MSVRITQDGLRSYDWDGDIKQNVEEHVDSFVCRLRCACTIDTGVTLGDIFRFVAADPALSTFIGAYCWCDMDAFHIEALLPAAKSSDLTRLEISVYAEVDENDFELSIDFGGIGPPSDTMRSEGERSNEVRWGVSLSPVNEFAALPVVLNHVLSVRKEFQEVWVSHYTFSLLEILEAIYFDISFHGGPASRDAFGASLSDMVADVEAGTATLVPLDEVLADADEVVN